MKTREEKIAEIKKRQSSKSVMLLNGDDLALELQTSTERLAEKLSEGIEINNLSELTEKISETYEQLHNVVSTVKEYLANITIPEEMTVKDFDEIIQAIKSISIENKIVADSNLLDQYKPADSDERDDNQQFYGFVDTKGNWYILKQLGAENSSWRYVFGSGNYAKNWNVRNTLNYKYLYEAING